MAALAAVYRALVFPAAQEREYRRLLDTQANRWLHWVSGTLIIACSALAFRYPAEWPLAVYIASPAIFSLLVLLPLQVKLSGLTAVLLASTHQLSCSVTEVLGIIPWSPLLAHIFYFSRSQGLAITLYGCVIHSVGVPLPFYHHIPVRLACELSQYLFLLSVGMRHEYPHGNALARFLVRLGVGALTGFVFDMTRRRCSWVLHAGREGGKQLHDSASSAYTCSLTNGHAAEFSRCCQPAAAPAQQSACTALQDLGAWAQDLDNSTALMDLAQQLLKRDPDLVYVPLTTQRVVVMMKIPDREPEELIRTWQDTLKQGLQQGCGGTISQLHVRRGCTQIIADLDRLPPPDQHQVGPASELHNLAMVVQREILPQLFSLISDDAAAHGQRAALPVTLQLEGQVQLLHGPGPSSGPGSSSSSQLAARFTATLMLPPAILAVTPAAVTAGMCTPWSPDRKYVVLQLQLCSPAQQGAVLLAHYPGSTTTTKIITCQPAASDGACVVEAMFELPQRPGLVQLSLMDESTGIMGPSAPLIVVPSAGCAQDLCSVQQSTAGISRPRSGRLAGRSPAAAAAHAGHPFLVDFGRWIGEACAAELVAASPNVAAAVASAHLNPMGVSQALQVGHGLLHFCLMMDLPACMEVVADQLVGTFGVLPATLVHSCGPSEWLGSIGKHVSGSAPGSAQLSVLHQAVRYGNTRVVGALVAWAGHRGIALDWQLPGPEGVTPMDLAAAQPNAASLMPLMRSVRSSSSNSSNRTCQPGTGWADSCPASSSDLASVRHACSAVRALSTPEAAGTSTPGCASPAAPGPGVGVVPMGLTSGNMPAWCSLMFLLGVSKFISILVNKQGLVVAASIPVCFAPYILLVAVLSLGLHKGPSSQTPALLRPLASRVHRFSLSPLGRNIGLPIHVHKLLCMFLMATGHLPVGFHANPWPHYVFGALCSVFESYDFRAALLVNFGIQLPVWFLVCRTAGLPGAMEHAVCRGVVNVALQYGMQRWRAVAAAKPTGKAPSKVKLA